MATTPSIGQLGMTRFPSQSIAAAMAQYTVKFIQKAGTYTAVIQSPDGDVIQEYKSIDANGKAQGVSPAITAGKPVTLYFQCASSRTLENDPATGTVDLSKAPMRYFINGQQLSFGSNGVCDGTFNADGTVNSGSGFKGVFEKFGANPSASVYYPGLRIVKDVADAFGHASGTVRIEATVTFGTQADVIQAEFPITVRKAAGDSARVAIESLTPNCFAIREKGDTCALIARVYLGGQLADPKNLGATYEWFRLELDQSSRNAVWVSQGSGTYQQGMHVCEVSDDMIDSVGLFKVKVSGLPCGDLSDTQTVTDLTDPYVMGVEITPSDLCIYEEVGDPVSFKPTLMTRSGKTVANAKHYFTAMDAAGNILGDKGYDNTSLQGGGNGTEFKVTMEQCIQAGGDVCVAIEATTARFENAWVDLSGGLGTAWAVDVDLARPYFDTKYSSVS